MPWYISIYVAFLIISLPFSVLLLHRMENDILHPLGGALSGILSVIFVVSYWLPNVIELQGFSTLLMYGFVLGWDCYSVVRAKQKLPEMFQLPDDEDFQLDNNAVIFGAMLMLPAYIFGALICLKAIS